MRKKTAIIIFLFFFIIFVKAFLGSIFSWVFWPNFILFSILTVSICCKLGWSFAWKFFVLAGLLVDSLFFFPIGFHVLVFFLLGGMMFFLKSRISSFQDEKSFLNSILLSLGLVFVYYIFLLALFRLMNEGIYFQGDWSILLNFLLIAFLASPTHFLLRRISKKFNLSSDTLVIKRW